MLNKIILLSFLVLPSLSIAQTAHLYDSCGLTLLFDENEPELQESECQDFGDDIDAFFSFMFIEDSETIDKIKSHFKNSKIFKTKYVAKDSKDFENYRCYRNSKEKDLMIFLDN